MSKESYSPPTQRDYPYLEPYLEAYELGYKADAAGLKEDDNPYEESGHERDTTVSDECNYQWYRGYCHGYEDSTK
jgi:hypothetical protein